MNSEIPFTEKLNKDTSIALYWNFDAKYKLLLVCYADSSSVGWHKWGCMFDG